MPGVEVIHSGSLASTANSRGGPPTAVAGKRVLRRGGRRQCDAPGPRFWAWAEITSTT